jgi:hypothetical protein
MIKRKENRREKTREGTRIEFVFGTTAPQWARASSFMRLLDHTK